MAKTNKYTFRLSNKPEQTVSSPNVMTAFGDFLTMQGISETHQRSAAMVTLRLTFSDSNKKEWVASKASRHPDPAQGVVFIKTVNG